MDEELPFQPIPNDRRPKRIIEKASIVQEPLDWVPAERLIHRPWKSSKPSEPPKEKKVRLPAIDYVILPNCGNVAKLKIL